MNQDKLLVEMKRLSMSPDRWITVQEAARRLGMTERGVVGNADYLEGTKVLGRWMVLAWRVEFLRKCRAGEVAPPRPPEKPQPPPPPEWKSECKGLEITGKSWADWDTGEIWVPAGQAAAVLERHPRHLNLLARRGKLRRRWSDAHGNEVLDPEAEISGSGKRLRAMFCLTDLDAIAAARDKRRSERDKRLLPYNHPERTTDRPDYRSFDDIGPNDELIPVAGAACILGIHPTGVRTLIRRGRLFAWQKIVGRQGSPVYVSATQVYRYRDSAYRRQYQERYLTGIEPKRTDEDPPKRRDDFKEDNDLTVDYGRSLKRNFGDCYSTRQAAQVLGVSISAIKNMRRAGTLKGYRRGRNAEQKFNLKRYWFFKKDDVEAIKRDPNHQKRRAAYLRYKRRQMFGENVDTPLFTDPAIGAISPISPPIPPVPLRKPRPPRKPPTDHVPQWVKDAERGPVTPGEDHYIPNDPRNAVFFQKTDLQRLHDQTIAALEELKEGGDHW